MHDRRRLLQPRRLLHQQPLRAAAAALTLGFAIASIASLAACDDAAPPTTQCLGSLTPTTSTVAAGASVQLSVGYANPDIDNTSALVVAWTTTGGGTLDRNETTLTLKAMDDPYGNPAGIGGSTSNGFTATGPSGTYDVHATVLAGAGCAESSFDATVIVMGSLPDGGRADAASDAPSETGD